MCGIAGIVELKKREIPIALLKDMNDAIKHRGPDDEGYILIDDNTGRFRLYSGGDSPKDIREKFPDVVRPGDIFPGNIGLSHRRFSIIDLSSRGHQPFMDKNGACCVVFNGEIYNYLELRDKLSKEGVSFRTESDTEVLIESYKRWGLDCFGYLNGFWAMAL
jgi:asparagine synthase (glutamine-hydrolysing)